MTSIKNVPWNTKFLTRHPYRGALRRKQNRGSRTAQTSDLPGDCVETEMDKEVRNENEGRRPDRRLPEQRASKEGQASENGPRERNMRPVSVVHVLLVVQEIKIQHIDIRQQAPDQTERHELSVQ